MNTALVAVPASIAIPLSVQLYGDIIWKERPVHQDDLFSRRHPKMSRLNRAKIFAPFAALDGFEGRVRSKEVPYVRRHEPDADEVWELNHRLNILNELTYNGKLARTNRVVVAVEYFEVCSDPDNEAFGVKGLYHTVTGIVQRVDHVNQALYVSEMEDASTCTLTIPFSDIYTIDDPSGQLFRRRALSVSDVAFRSVR